MYIFASRRRTRCLRRVGEDPVLEVAGGGAAAGEGLRLVQLRLWRGGACTSNDTAAAVAGAPHAPQCGGDGRRCRCRREQLCRHRGFVAIAGFAFSRCCGTATATAPYTATAAVFTKRVPGSRRYDDVNDSVPRDEFCDYHRSDNDALVQTAFQIAACRHPESERENARDSASERPTDSET